MSQDEDGKKTPAGGKLPTQSGRNSMTGYYRKNALTGERRRYKEVAYAKAPKRPPLGSLPLVGLVVGGIFFGGFGAWAALMPLASAAIAPGRLVVESSRQEVNHREGGIIKEILVRDGATVTQGDVLMRLEPVQSALQTDTFGEELVVARANEARLLAHIEDADELTFPEDLQARADDEPQIASILRTQRNLFLTRKNSIAEQSGLLDQRMAQLEQRISGFNQQVRAADVQLRLARDEIRDLERLLADELLPISQLRARQRQVAEIEGNRGLALASIAQTEEAIQSARIERGLLQTQFAEENARELERVRTRINEMQGALQGAEDVLTRTEILAPATGKIVDMKFFTVGSTISPSAPILSIIPSDDRLVIDARVNPLDREVVYPGMKADVRLSVFKLRTTPTLDGTLVDISADAISNNATGEFYYKARVILDDDEAARYELSPGMPVEVMLKLNERTFLDYLLEPVREGIDRAFIDD